MSENTSRFPQLLVSMPRHNGERYARLMVEQFKQMNAMLGKSRWHELFGTPERAARTVAEYGKTIYTCDECLLCHDHIGATCEINGDCPWVDGESGYDALLGWLRGDAE